MFYIIVSPGYSPSFLQQRSDASSAIHGVLSSGRPESTPSEGLGDHCAQSLCTKGAPPYSTKYVKMVAVSVDFLWYLWFPPDVFFVASCCITILPFPWFGDDSWADSWADSSADSSDARLGFRHKLRFGAILRRRGLLCPDFTTFHHNWLGWG